MVAEKAEESLEAIRTGRIDAGDLKRLNPFSGRPLPFSSSHYEHETYMRSLSGLGKGLQVLILHADGGSNWLRERDVSFLIGKGPGESSSSEAAPSSAEADTVKVCAD